MRVRLAALLALPVLLGAPGVAAADGLSYRNADCFDDPDDDVVDFATDAPADFPRADVLTHCVDVTQQTLRLFAFPAEAVDPETDPSWAAPTTFARWKLDVDGDDEVDFEVDFYVPEDDLQAAVFDAGTDEQVCGPGDGVQAAYIDDPSGDFYVVDGIVPVCLDDADQVSASVELFYDTDPEDPDAPQLYDIAPDTGLGGPVDRTPRQCMRPAARPLAVAPPPNVERIACGTAATAPVGQAVAISEAYFDDRAASAAIIARDDDFADALAGSALGFGSAPLLYTFSPGAPAGLGQRLAPETRQELLRVLVPGPEAPVYLLGGTGAISQGVEDELRALGYRVDRIAGPSRFETAADIARRVKTLVAEFVDDPAFDFPALRSVFVTTGRNWPDAVVAGSVAAYWGIPVLLTEPPAGGGALGPCAPPTEQNPNPDYDPSSSAWRGSCRLHPATESVLRELAPEYVYVVGGRLAVSSGGNGVLQQLGCVSSVVPPEQLDCDGRPYAAGGDRAPFATCAEDVCRLGGESRFQTGLLVGNLGRFLLRQYARPDVDQTASGSLPPDATFALAVNVDGPLPSNRWTSVLSATVFSGGLNGGVFIPVGDGGSLGDIPEWICARAPVEDPGLGTLELTDLLVAGGTDVLPDATVDALQRALAEPGC